MSLLSRWLSRNARTKSAQAIRRSLRPRCLEVEALEQRWLPSTTSLPTLATPTFTAQTYSSSQINLSWKSVSGAAGYKINEWISGSWRQIGTMGSNSTSCTVSNLSANTTYSFDVGAYNSSSTTWAPNQSATTSIAVNHPTAAYGYTPVTGSLFGSSGPSYRDVRQGAVGDCWLLASLAEVAARYPQDIRNMFTAAGSTIENGITVSLYNVRLFNTAGVAQYYQVDAELPSGGGYYDHPANGVLWVALAEKAYVQANGARGVKSNSQGSNSYGALEGGDPIWALQAITGKSASAYSTNPANIATAWNQGKLIVLATNAPSSTYIVGSHAYAVVNYTSTSSQPYQIYNPWGADSNGWALSMYKGRQVYGLFTANAAFVSQNFTTQTFGVGDAEGGDSGGSAGANGVGFEIAGGMNVIIFTALETLDGQAPGDDTARSGDSNVELKLSACNIAADKSESTDAHVQKDMLTDDYWDNSANFDWAMK